MPTPCVFAEAKISARAVELAQKIAERRRDEDRAAARKGNSGRHAFFLHRQ